MQRLHHHIGGKPGEPHGGGWLEVFDPANAQPFAQVAAGTAADVEDAIAAADAAAPAAPVSMPSDPATIVAKQGEATLQSQCVPTDEALWSTDRYADFLSYRRQALADRMNAFIQEKSLA